jgi:hypothetical protein
VSNPGDINEPGAAPSAANPRALPRRQSTDKARTRTAEPHVAPNLEADERAKALLLSSQPPEDILALLLEGDPLRLTERSAVRLKRLALVMDCERVAEHAACLSLAARFTRELPFETWVTARVDEAIWDLLARDVERVRRGESNGGQAYEFMLHLFNIPDERSLKAAVQFNTLPLRTRKSFMLLTMDHWSIAECLEAGYGPLEELKVRAQTAMAALLGCIPRRVKFPKGAQEFS